ENSAMSTPVGSNSARSRTTTSSSPKATVAPADDALASATSSPTGKPRSARIESMVSPTAPVAPTTATLYCLPIGTPLTGRAATPRSRALSRVEVRRGTQAGSKRHAPVEHEAVPLVAETTDGLEIAQDPAVELQSVGVPVGAHPVHRLLATDASGA